MKISTVFLTGAVCVMLAACSGPSKEMRENTPEALYQMGYDAFVKEDYTAAAEYFDEVERQHPYSVWSGRSQIMAAYTFYQQNKYDEAVLVLDRFIQLHPGNRNTPYAYYLKGICYFEQMSDIGRDQKTTQDTLATFQELLARFPSSVYEADVTAKIQLIENYLSGKEMAVGRYYQKQDNLFSALNRFKSAVLTYPESAQTPEAFYRLGVCYQGMGLKKQARDIQQYMLKTYPHNQWTQKVTQLIQE